MAEHGFEAATLARVVEEAGIPMSSVYHYFGSKDGILLAVMERGADRFFAGQLARFALAVIDGAFVACQADRGATLEQLLQPLAPSLAASRRALLARAD
jgi:AcrR family transcriptional regulator